MVSPKEWVAPLARGPAQLDLKIVARTKTVVFGAATAAGSHLHTDRLAIRVSSSALFASLLLAPLDGDDVHARPRRS